MTSVRGRGRPARRGQASKAATDPSSSNRDHKNPLESNKLGPSEAPTGSEAPAGPEIPVGPEAPLGPPQASPLLQDSGTNCYSQQDLDRIIQTFFQASKGESGDKIKAKTLDVYRSRSHIECYNFCHQCEDHFATCKASGPKRIPFAAFFLRDQINFRWQ